MATHAIGVCRGQGIVVANVAARASGGCMGAGKSEAGISVVESGGAPDDGVVARGAERSGEASGYVIGNATADRLRAAPIGCVAAVAIGIRRSQGIVSAHVALGAGGDLACRRHLV